MTVASILPKRAVPQHWGASGGILSEVGNTPLVPLGRHFADAPFEVLGKLEGMNPGGSIKDRPARRIVEQAIADGRLRPGSVVVESSSGNMAIGLAQVCNYYGLRMICVVDAKTVEQNIRIMEAYGAEVQCITEPDPETGELLPARLRRVRELLESHPGSFWPNQYENMGNPESHYATTVQEIYDSLGGDLDYLFIATSTCGTIRGCARFLRDQGSKAQVVAVDLEGSLIFSDEKKARYIPGIGAGMKPPHRQMELIDRVVHVTDLDCVVGCRRLVRTEAMLVGGSSGGVVAAIEKLQNEIPEGSKVVAILPDRGERYLDTVFSDAWVRDHWGDVEHLWLGER